MPTPRSLARSLLVLASLLVTPLPSAWGAGFAVADHGAGAAGLASAFTGLADDPSAIFYNPGGLAFQEKGAVSAGVALSSLDRSQFQGLAPGLGSGTTGEQETSLEVLAHAYLVKPLRPGVVFGLGFDSPFHHSADWADPDTFAGRTISLASEIQSFDLNPNLAARFGPKLGIGIGAVLRLSDVSQLRRLQLTDPQTGDPLDVASLDLSSDSETGVGWNLGILHRPGRRFAWGLSYRSAIDLDYGGGATLTQIETGDPQLDALVAASLPFGQELALRTRIEFPDLTRLGLAFHLGDSAVVTTDVDLAGWSRIERIDFALPNNPGLDQTLELRLDDTVTFRAGLRLTLRGGAQWRFGYALDPSPLPDETVSPFLPDADRNVFAVGFVKDWLGVSLSFIQSDDRTVTTSLESLNGVYRSRAWTLGITVTK